MENGGMKLFASVVLGIIIAIFVGIGINAFYPEPSYPNELMTFTSVEPTEAEQEASNKAYLAFEEQRKTHSSVVGIIAIIISVIAMVSSQLFTARNTVISQGLLVGGLLLVCYGAVQGISSGSTMTAFISTGVGLAALIFIIVRRFGNTPASTSA